MMINFEGMQDALARMESLRFPKEEIEYTKNEFRMILKAEGINILRSLHDTEDETEFRIKANNFMKAAVFFGLFPEPERDPKIVLQEKISKLSPEECKALLKQMESK